MRMAAPLVRPAMPAPTAPFPTGQLMQRYGLDPGPALRASWRAKGRWSAASSCPVGTEREWCDSDVLRPGAAGPSLARLRKEVEGGRPDRAGPAFLPSWQNGRRLPPKAGAGPEPPARGAGCRCKGWALTPEKSGSGTSLPRRLGAYSPKLARPALHQR